MNQKIDPKIVKLQTSDVNQIQEMYDQYFNKDGKDPLEVSQGEPRDFKWIDGSTITVNEIYRFKVLTSTTNPVGLKMDLFIIQGPAQGKLPFSESKLSDYSFLRTPLWEQPASDVLLNEGAKIVITQNIPGKSNNDLVRKAFIIETMLNLGLKQDAWSYNPKPQLVNMSGNDSQYLKAVARKHNLNYQDA